MPIAFSKDARTTIFLREDLQRPESERVGFLCRFITSRERDLVYDLMGQARNEKDNDKSRALLMQAMGVGLIGPKDARTPNGESVPCSLEGLPMVLSISEMWQLGWEYPNAVSLSEVDLKKSAPPSSSNVETPATDSPPASAASVPPPAADSALVA